MRSWLYCFKKLVLKNFSFFISMIIENLKATAYKWDKSWHAKRLLLVQTNTDPLQSWKMQPCLAVRKIERRACRAIRTMQLVREMHSSLNVSCQPFRKRDKFRRVAPSALWANFSRTVWALVSALLLRNKVSNRIANPPANTPDIGPPVCSDRNVCTGRRVAPRPDRWTDIFPPCASVIYTESVSWRNMSGIGNLLLHTKFADRWAVSCEI